MASIESAAVPVSVEAAIYAALNEAVQHISDTFKVQVKNVAVDWHDVSVLSGRAYHVRRIDLDSFSTEFTTP